MTLEARQLVVRAGRRDVIRHVDLRIELGERVAVVGPNGAGKSTLLRALAGLAPAHAGRVELDGADVSDLSRRDLARRLAWMGQGATVPTDRTALDVALLGRAPWLGRWGWPAQGDIDIARAALVCLGVDHLAERTTGAMSGGERQRVVLAAALAQQTPWLLLDEPTSAQDFEGTARMIEALRSIAAEQRAVVVAMHDLTTACRAFDRLVLVHDGQITADGTPLDVVRSDAARAAWGDTFAVHDVDGAPVVVLARAGAS